MVSAAIPRDPLARFLEIAACLTARKHWWEGANVARYAALPLVLADGAPADVAARVDVESAAMANEASWFSDLRGAMRWVIAAWVAAAGREARSFTAACEAIRARFRAAGVPRGGAYEIVAAAMLHVAQADDDVGVRRMQQIYETMKGHHWWLTGSDDLPAAALLATVDDGVAAMTQRIEDIYQRLRGTGIKPGSGLQMASHILYLAPGREAQVTARFGSLHEGFRAAGIRMWDADLDELALLCLLPWDGARTVRTVVEHRAAIKAGIRVGSPTASFSFACGTAFLEAHAGASLEPRLRRDVDVATLAMAANAAEIRQTEKRAHG
jgi:hypothetical protein